MAEHVQWHLSRNPLNVSTIYFQFQPQNREIRNLEIHQIEVASKMHFVTSRYPNRFFEIPEVFPKSSHVECWMIENSVTQFRSHRKCVTSLMVQKKKRKKNVDSIAVTDHRTRVSLETESKEKDSNKKK